MSDEYTLHDALRASAGLPPKKPEASAPALTAARREELIATIEEWAHNFPDGSQRPITREELHAALLAHRELSREGEREPASSGQIQTAWWRSNACSPERAFTEGARWAESRLGVGAKEPRS